MISFLTYCNDITNLLFLEFWERLSIPIKNHSTLKILNFPVLNFAIGKKLHFAGISFRDLVVKKHFTGIYFRNFSKYKRGKSFWISVFLLLINVIVIKYVTKTVVLLLYVGISDTRYQYHTLIKHEEKKNLKLDTHLISRVFNFAILLFWNFPRDKIWRKSSKIAKMAKFNTREI